MSYLYVPIKRINNVEKSCKFIEGNPPYCSRVKVPAVSGHQGYQTLLEKLALVSYCQVRKQYKQRAGLSICHIVNHTQLQCMSEREGVGIREREQMLEIILLPLGFTFGADSIFEEVAGFSPFMVSPRKNTVFIVSCV